MVFTMERTGEGEDDYSSPSDDRISVVRAVREKPKRTVSSSISVVTPVTDGAHAVCPARRVHSNSDRVCDNMPLGGRTVAGDPQPASVDPHWLSRGLGAAYSVLGKRSPYPCQPAPYQRQPASFPHPQKARVSSTMDYVSSPESFYAPDYTAKAAFAASPNSLYMYDQERHDMQNTLHNGTLGQTCSASDVVQLTAVEPEFDLNPQYENSNSLEGFFNGTVAPDLLPSMSEESPVSMGAEKSLSAGMLGLLGVCRQGLKQGGPTLTELNMSMDPYLFEDIDSIIGEEGKPLATAAVKPVVTDTSKASATVANLVKSEVPPQQVFAAQARYSSSQVPDVRMSQPQSNAPSLTTLFSSKAQNVAVVPPISVTTTSIKTEPMDMNDGTGKSCLHKMLSSPSLKPAQGPVVPAQTSPPPERQVMPVVGQTRAPALGQQVKSESVEEKWKEIEKFIHDPEPSTSRKRKRHESGGSAIMSDEEDAKSSRIDTYSDDDSDSDVDSDFSDTPFEESLTELAKKSKQYFWQYNVQAKGPKGTRLKLNIGNSDPHHPNDFEDPVFDASSTSLVGIRHGGKARKGDGNEVSPNPRKLCQIGQQLYKLNRQINSCQVSNDLPASVRNKSRKEKNKLASRACRLKKKAQHEANKIKLTGLDCEQGELLEVVHLMWPQLKEKAQRRMKGLVHSPDSAESLSDKLDNILKTKRKMIIAGNTTDFVNQVIAKVEDGDPAGGLPIKPKVKK